MTLPRTEMKEQAELDKQTVREILGLQEMWVIFGSAPRGGDEIAVIGRSMLEMLIHIGASVDVPSSHVAEGRTYETRTFDTDAPGGFRPMIRVQSGPERPEDAFVAIPYKGHWFWVDDRDYPSKGIFSFLLILLSLNDVDPGKGAPIITILAKWQGGTAKARTDPS